MSQDEINSLLVFKDERPSAPPAEESPAPTPAHIPERARARSSATRKPEVTPEPQAQAQALSSQQQKPSRSDVMNTKKEKEIDDEVRLNYY